MVGAQDSNLQLSATGSNLCEQRRRGQETNGRRHGRFVFESSPSAAHLNNSPPSRVPRKGQQFRGFWLKAGVEDSLDQLRFGGSYMVAKAVLGRCARPLRS